MILPGRLAATTLGDLLGQLHRGRVTGILELLEDSGSASGQLHRIFLNEGLVDAAVTPLPAPRLGELLLCEGALTRAGLLQLSRLLIERPCARAGRLLLEQRLSSPSAVRTGLHRQLRLRVDALFHLRHARVRFHVRAPAPEPDVDPLDAQEFLHGRPRARADRKRDEPAQNAGHEGQPFTSREQIHTSDQRAALRVLGLPAGADLGDIQRAFRLSARLFHPDRHPRATAQERAELLRHFAELSHAYHSLLRSA
ncbi:MAG TPA: DUF4388 domain-containing protein [Polyangiaceae bacterium]|nr:DUF4388 domain-containing protein [Polyangiaceae bacterium]